MDLPTITHFMNGLLMAAIPILLGIYLTNKFRLAWKFWWIGGITFIASQVLHLPFNSYILNPVLLELQQNLTGLSGIFLISLLLGLSAGVFETAARYAMYRWWLKDARSWRSGVLAGAGHGGVEAIILGGLVLLTFINMMAYRNMDLTTLNLNADQIELTRQQIQAYWGLPWYDVMLGALERVFTIPFHIAASVIVLQTFIRKPGQLQFGWLGLAVLLHTLMDASAVFVANQYTPYTAEAMLGILAILDILIIFLLRQPENPSQTPLPESPLFPLSNFSPSPVEETSENLEKTRYQ